MAGITFQPVFCRPPYVHEYGSHVVHRNRTPKKSQWGILYSNELASFCHCVSNGWIEGEKGWGFHLVNGRPQYLGVDEVGTMQVFIARFEDGNANWKWHGYPLDHVRRPEDCPPDWLRRVWIRMQLLTKPKLARICKRKPCTL
jgi:hypothetical protein